MGREKEAPDPRIAVRPGSTIMYCTPQLDTTTREGELRTFGDGAPRTARLVSIGTRGRMQGRQGDLLHIEKPAPPDSERPLERIYSLCGRYEKAPPSLYVHRPSRARRSLYSYNRHGLEYFPSSGIKAACGSRGPPVLPNYQIIKAVLEPQGFTVHGHPTHNSCMVLALVRSKCEV